MLKHIRGKRGHQGYQGVPGKQGIQGIQGIPGTSSNTIEFDATSTNISVSILKTVADYTLANDGEDGFLKTIIYGNDTQNMVGVGEGVSGSMDEGSSQVYVITVSLDKKHLYVGGKFTMVDNILANNIAMYTLPDNDVEGSWTTLSAGLNGTVRAIAINADGIVYVGGEFTGDGMSFVDGNGIAVWNGDEFINLEAGKMFTLQIINPGRVFCLTLDETLEYSRLYIGGAFDLYGEGENVIYCSRIAMWDGTNMNVVGTGFNEGSVNAITVTYNKKVYAGGSFIMSGQTNISRISFLGTVNEILQWMPIQGIDNNGVNGDVLTLATDERENVFVGGSFTKVYAGEQILSVNNIAAFNGTDWSDMRGGLGYSMGNPNIYVNTIYYDFSTGSVHAGGNFNKIMLNNGVASGYAIYNNGWHTLDLSPNYLNCLAICDNILYYGGIFINYFDEMVHSNISGYDMNLLTHVNCRYNYKNVFYNDLYLTFYGQRVQFYYDADISCWVFTKDMGYP